MTVRDIDRRLDAMAFTACFGAPWLPITQCLTSDTGKHLRSSRGEAVAGVTRVTERIKRLEREYAELRRAALEQMNATERFVEMAARPGAVVYAHPDDVERVTALLNGTIGRLGLRSIVKPLAYLAPGKPVVVDHEGAQRRLVRFAYG